MPLDAPAALLAASGLHAGFSVVVTGVVYPALADAPRTDGWPRRHADHSRRVARVVGPLYLLVAAACLWTLLSRPGAAALVAVAGNAAAALVTVVAAAPTHARLTAQGPRPELLDRLLRVDRLRTAATLAALVAAVLAAR